MQIKKKNARRFIINHLAFFSCFVIFKEFYFNSRQNNVKIMCRAQAKFCVSWLRYRSGKICAKWFIIIHKAYGFNSFNCSDFFNS